MNKAELVEFVADKTGSSKAEAERYLEAVMEGVVEALRQPGGDQQGEAAVAVEVLNRMIYVAKPASIPVA